VLLIVGDITPTIEGLRITGGNAAGLGGEFWQSETFDIGGGVCVIAATATIKDNRVFGNTAPGDHGLGGGLCLTYSDATLSRNIISANTAYQGGGLKLGFGDVTVSGNTFFANTATHVGGGASLYDSDATVSGNIFSANTATTGGGGLELTVCKDTTLINNVIADNQAGAEGSGLTSYGSSPRLLHNTIARNKGGDGSGVHVTDNSAVELVNTVLVGHRVGIYVSSSSTADLESTLWGSGAWANTFNRSGPGTINHSDDRTGDPAFVNPAAGNYHIGPGSAAIDAGADAGVSTDIDGDLRPIGPGYDLGADEWPGSGLQVTKRATPDPVQPGAQLTYTIHITNVTGVDLHATITDTLPLSVTLDEASGGTLALPGGTLAPPDGTVVLPDGRVAVTWTAVITKHGGLWMGTILVTVDEDYVGSLANLVEVTTEEGVLGKDRVAVIAGSPAFLPLVLR
jgi:uncharacterized repeat protein (TIGR01451 family)